MATSKKTLVLLLLGLVALCGLLTAYVFLHGRIPSNAPDTVGNWAGNLNNHGLFCESDGKVYFSNGYDNNTLYSMNLDETELKKINNAQVEQINAGGDYLYYYQTNSASASSFSFMSRFSGIYRAKKNGKGNASCLTRDTATLIQLYGDYLYYQHYAPNEGIRLHKLRTDKSQDTMVSKDNINPSSSGGGMVYFGGQEKDRCLYTLQLIDDSVHKVWDADLWNPLYYDGYVYYMDVPNNYRLCRYDLSGSEPEILTEDRIDCFNIAGNYVYYQKNDAEAPALKRIGLDGSGEEIVQEGLHENINVTTNYVYFTMFGQPAPVYHTPVNGPVSVSTFSAAANAISE